MAKLIEKLGIDPEVHKEFIDKEYVLNTYRNMAGVLKYNYIKNPKEAKPRFLIIEKYRLSTYLGQYGAGRTVKTFSLLPGEKTTISVSSYLKTTKSRSEASSILDSFTEESAESFEDSLQSENSSKTNSEKSFNYHAEAEASANWGWGSAKVSGGVSGGSDEAREEFAKNVSASTTQNSNKASSKRDVEVNTSYEENSETGENRTVTREISNINVGRSLNFTFRQMNQEFLTFLHLVDVRVAFFNGYRGSKEEVPLYQLADLVSKYVINDHVESIIKIIIKEVQNIRDHKGNKVLDFFKVDEQNNTVKVNKDFSQTYSDETGNSFTVPGLITNVNKNVMRTDGVVVESLLGHSGALDDYSDGLQVEKLKRHEVENKIREVQLEIEKQKLKILKDGNKEHSEVYSNLFNLRCENKETVSEPSNE